MEIDEDIYSNLSNNENHLLEEVEKLQQQNNLLQELIDSLETDIEKLCTKITDMKTIQDTLTKNISELYKTAKAELERKDRTIAELRSKLDEYLFRRRGAPIKRERDNSPNVGRPSVDPTAKKMRFENDENWTKRTFHRRSRSRSRSNERSKMHHRNRSSDRNWRDNRNDRSKYGPDCRRTLARDDKYGDRNYRNNSRREYNSMENHRHPTETRITIEKQHASLTQENHQNANRDTVEKRNVENIQLETAVKDVTYLERNEENEAINKNDTEIPAKSMKNDENLKNNEADNKKKKNTNIEAVTEKLKKRLHQDQPKELEGNNTVSLKLSDIVEFMNQPEESENEANKQIKEIVKNSKFVVVDNEIKEIINFGTITTTDDQENNRKAVKISKIYSDEKENVELTKAPQAIEKISQHKGSVSIEQNNNEDKTEETTHIDEKCNKGEYAKKENPKTINPHKKSEVLPKSSKTNERKQSSNHRSGEKIERDKFVPFQNEEKSEKLTSSYTKNIESKRTIRAATSNKDVEFSMGETDVINIAKIGTRIKEIINMQDSARENEKHEEGTVPKSNVIVPKNIEKFETKKEDTSRENEKTVAETSGINGNNLTQNGNSVQEVEKNKQEKSVLGEDEENSKSINPHKKSDKSLKSSKTDTKHKFREKRRESSKHKHGGNIMDERSIPTQNKEQSEKFALSDLKKNENKYTGHEDTSKEDAVPNTIETAVKNIDKIWTNIKDVTNIQDSSRENEKHVEETVPKNSEIAPKNIKKFEIKNYDTSRENEKKTVANTSSENENNVTENESAVQEVEKNKQGKSVVNKENPKTNNFHKKSDKSPKTSKTDIKDKDSVKRKEFSKHRHGEKIKKETSVPTQNEEKSKKLPSSDLKEIENKHTGHEHTSKEDVVANTGENVLKNIEEVETKSKTVTYDQSSQKHNEEVIVTKSGEVIPKNIEKFETKNEGKSLENEKKNDANSNNENGVTQNVNDVRGDERNKQEKSVLDENAKTNNPHKKLNKSPKNRKINNTKDNDIEKRKKSNKHRHGDKIKKERYVPPENEETSEKFASSDRKEIENKHRVYENFSKEDVVPNIGEHVLKNIEKIESKEIPDQQHGLKKIEEHNAEKIFTKTNSKNENSVGEDEKNKQEESVLDEEKSKRIKEKLAKLSSKHKEDTSIEDQANKKKSILDEEKMKSVKVQLEKLSSKKATRTENKTAPRNIISLKNDNNSEKSSMAENKAKKSKETKKDDSADSLVVEESDRVLRSATRRNNSREEEKKKKQETSQKEIEVSLNLEQSDFSTMNLSHDEIPVLHISEDGENSLNSSYSSANSINVPRVLNTSSGRKRRRVVMTMID